MVNARASSLSTHATAAGVQSDGTTRPADLHGEGSIHRRHVLWRGGLRQSLVVGAAVALALLLSIICTKAGGSNDSVMVSESTGVLSETPRAVTFPVVEHDSYGTVDDDEDGGGRVGHSTRDQTTQPLTIAAPGGQVQRRAVHPSEVTHATTVTKPITVSTSGVVLPWDQGLYVHQNGAGEEMPAGMRGNPSGGADAQPHFELRDGSPDGTMEETTRTVDEDIRPLNDFDVDMQADTALDVPVKSDEAIEPERDGIQHSHHESDAHLWAMAEAHHEESPGSNAAPTAASSNANSEPSVPLGVGSTVDSLSQASTPLASQETRAEPSRPPLLTAAIEALAEAHVIKMAALLPLRTRETFRGDYANAIAGASAEVGLLAWFSLERFGGVDRAAILADPHEYPSTLQLALKQYGKGSVIY